MRAARCVLTIAIALAAIAVPACASYYAGLAVGIRAGVEAGLAACSGEDDSPSFEAPDKVEVRMLTPDRGRAAAAEAARRARASRESRPDVLAGAFPQQRAVVLDESPFKCEFCTRRAAKTYTWGLEAIHDSFTHPMARYLFLGLVRDEARSMFWEDVLKDINRHYPGIGMRFNESRLEAVLPNGANIRIGAADASSEEMRKLLGLKYRKIAIDEAQDWQHTDLRVMVFEILKPALADWRGSVSLLGTPGRVAKGLFYDVTNRTEPGWSLHTWTTFDNPYMREKWAAEIADLKARFPGIEETPAFQRAYLGRWVVDESNLVYRYRAGRNDFNGKLPQMATPWHYVLGVDLGYADDTAFVLGAYHLNLPVLYILEAAKKKGMDISAVAQRIKLYQSRFSIETVVIDGSNKQAVAEMQNRHGLSLVPSDKTGKADFIELMNSEFIAGPRILVDPTACEPLTEEYRRLVWRDKKVAGTAMVAREEHPLLPNHACDGALYLWRYTYSYAHRPLEAPPESGTQAWAQAEAARMLAEAQRKMASGKSEQSEQFGPVDHESAWGAGDDGSNWGV